MNAESWAEGEAPSPPRPCALAVVWLGHATVWLELDGVRLLTDPVLRERVAHLRRASPSPQLAEQPDVVLVSHAHRDHLDLPSLRPLAPGALAVVPRGVGRLASRAGFREVAEAVEGDELEVRGIRVCAVHAEHAPGRDLPRGPAPLGFVVAGSQTAYFAGDTDLFDGLALLRPLDVVFLPVSGWGPRVGSGHLDPERAAEAVRLLAPRVAVPIHWGTFRPVYRRTPYPADVEAPERFAQLVRRRADAVEVRVLVPGERWLLASSGAGDVPAAAAREAPQADRRERDVRRRP